MTTTEMIIITIFGLFGIIVTIGGLVMLKSFLIPDIHHFVNKLKR